MRIAKLAFVACLLVLAGAVVSGLPALAQPDKAPRRAIVVFNDGVSDPASLANEHAVRYGFLPAHKYGKAIKGYAAVLNGRQLAAISDDPRVAFVSEDRTVWAVGKEKPCQPWPSCRGGSDPTDPPADPPADPQEVPTGVARVGQPLSGNDGVGVAVAVLDTGADFSHPDLAGAIVANKNCTHRRKPAKDDEGHGTHVAGTILARDNDFGVVGVAPAAGLVPVKVLNSQGTGTWSQVICGLDWVAANAADLNIKVANMSLSGGGVSDGNCGLSNGDALHAAICALRDAGVTLVVAAGNEGADAALSVPAAYDDAVITVSALADSDGAAGGLGAPTYYGADDAFASFSNWGSPVDIGAPGVDILSTTMGGGYGLGSGTSMAAPHVAGAAALYHAAHPGASWSDALAGLLAGAEPLGAGHSDPSGRHPEPVLLGGGL